MRFRVLVMLLGLAPATSGAVGEPAVLNASDVPAVILGSPGPGGAPQWRAVIEPGQLLLKSPTSAGWYRVTLPPPVEDPSAHRLSYDAGRVKLDLLVGGCAIPGYRAHLPNHISLRWDGGVFEGCSGTGAMPERTAGTTWELMRIAGEAAPQTRSPAVILIFGRNGSLGGTLACNDGGIEATWTDAGGFAPGRARGFMQTAMGCNDPPSEAFGRRFWNGLETARRWRRDGAKLLVTLADGSEAELRFLIADQISSVSRP